MNKYSMTLVEMRTVCKTGMV